MRVGGLKDSSYILYYIGAPPSVTPPFEPSDMSGPCRSAPFFFGGPTPHKKVDLTYVGMS